MAKTEVAIVTEMKDAELIHVPLKANAVVLHGTFALVDATGHGVASSTAVAATQKCLGVWDASYDNTGGADADRNARRRVPTGAAFVADRARHRAGDADRWMGDRAGEGHGAACAAGTGAAPRLRQRLQLSEWARDGERRLLSDAGCACRAGDARPCGPIVPVGGRGAAGRRDRVQSRVSGRALAERRAGRLELRDALGAGLVDRHGAGACGDRRGTLGLAKVRSGRQSSPARGRSESVWSNVERPMVDWRT